MISFGAPMSRGIFWAHLDGDVTTLSMSLKLHYPTASIDVNKQDLLNIRDMIDRLLRYYP